MYRRRSIYEDDELKELVEAELVDVLELLEFVDELLLLDKLEEEDREWLELEDFVELLDELDRLDVLELERDEREDVLLLDSSSKLTGHSRPPPEISRRVNSGNPVAKSYTAGNNSTPAAVVSKSTIRILASSGNENSQLSAEAPGVNVSSNVGGTVAMLYDFTDREAKSIAGPK